MLHRTLNLGILAHVDAGKTTLTERLLYEAGVIDKLGSVDAGTTQTDTLALERQRGITIRSAVASFAIDDVTVNLIDTPGHPDFIAEVERVLSVLDGAVLVISAVEGVQPQTRILMRALQRLQIPTLVFVNKIDRPGADDVRVLGSIADRLTPAIIPLETAHELGTRRAYVTPADPGDGAFLARLAELLAERDESILAAYVADASRLRPGQLRNQLAAQTQRAVVHPVFFGSAITGAGVEALLAGIAELLPVAAGNPDDPVAATVFKIERGASGEKIAYVRMFSGTIRTRDPLRFGGDACHKVTAIAVFDHGTAAQRASVTAGEVGKLWGLGSIRVGDRIGEAAGEAAHHQFPPPTLESVAVAPDRANGPGLRLALAQLAEQDPLINVRQDDTNGEISVSLYGEVQKEVIQATLADDYGIEVVFRETTPLYIERPIAAGEGVELLHAETNPFLATIGLRLGPGAVDSGIEFRIEVDHSSVPLYVYKTLESFTEHMGDYVRHALQQGLYGWPVSDCVVTLATCSYSVPDGPPSRRGPLSTAADFRKLTPIVVRQALQSAGTVVCEPVERVGLEIPVDAIGVVNATLGRFGASIEAHASTGKLSTVRAVLPTARAHDLQRQLPALTNGEGVLEASFAGYRRVSGPQPARPSRRDQSPA